jgi:FtsZ-interacting cell division protein ZipA
MSDFWNSSLGLALAFLLCGTVGLVPSLLLYGWLTRRDHRRWQREAAERQRRSELQDRLRDMEEAIQEEQLSDEGRGWRRQHRARQAAIHREALRRLGLPEEEKSDAHR